MQATMIKIERDAKMEKAIARCKANHPKVRRVDASAVKVYGKGSSYIVRFSEPKPGLKLASCPCKAGAKGQLCYHIPAALAAPVVIAVAPAAPPPPVAIPSPTKPQPKPFTPARIIYSVYVCPHTLRRIPACTVDGWSV